MGNNELLLAISDMMDQKLESINVRMDTMEDRLSARIDAVDATVDALDERLSANIRDINITMENILIPRIKHMEQCYLDTSKRYINETGRIDGLVADVQVIKSVVLNHSEQLQKIS